MKKELDYFTIDGEFGGNQDWFTNVVMHIGGCAAATACDSCIYLSRLLGMKNLYPFDIEKLCKKDYIAFSQRMKPYLKPRMHGVNKLWMYTEGLGKYLEDVGEAALKMEEFSGEHTYEEAKKFLIEHIDCEFPVPYLMLQHKNREKFKDFIWHWFLVVGYEVQGDRFFVKTATYGEATWFDLEELWNTGAEEKGGLIGYEMADIKFS